MFSSLLCSMGLHKGLSTREGGDKKGGAPAQFIYYFCVRPGCTHAIRINTHTGEREDVSGGMANAQVNHRY